MAVAQLTAPWHDAMAWKDLEGGRGEILHLIGIYWELLGTNAVNHGMFIGYGALTCFNYQSMSGSATQVSHQCSFRTCRVLLLRDDIY